MARGHKIAMAAVACLLVLAALAWLNRPRDDPAKATVGDAIRAFRANDDSAERSKGSEKAALGVYRYATDGSESVQGPGFGTTHDYGGVSTITLSDGRCGVRERWQVLAGRWSEVEGCTQSGTARVVEFHEFFGEGQEDPFRCRGVSTPDPSELQPGARFSTSCRSEDSSVSTQTQIVGFETISVGDEPSDAVHIESRSVLGGDSSGSAKREEWRRRSDGLLLRRSSENEADTSAGGGTHYSEQYTIRLLSLTPQR